MKDYTIEINYVKSYLKEHNGEHSRRSAETFRNRSEHCVRVLNWIYRIVEKLNKDEQDRIDLEALEYAAIFHDIGYGSEAYKNSHGIEGSDIFKCYALNKGLDSKLIDKVYYLIRNHSDKIKLQAPSEISIELRVLMEADWLDEEGAMSISWDLMTLGKTDPTGYELALEKIKKFSAHILGNNPMVDKPARDYWAQKQAFVEAFIKELKYELFLL